MNGLEIVEEARSWLDTKYQHQGRLKKTDTHKGGADCAGFVIGVAKKFEYECPEFTNYRPSPDKDLFRQTVDQYLQKIDIKDVKMGDLLIFGFDGEAQHIAIITHTHPMRIIHSYAAARKVVEHNVDTYWASKIKGAYRFKNIEEVNI